MSTSTDIKSIIDSKKITVLQYATIFICAIMNVLDGMDVLVIAFSASAISKEWAIPSQHFRIGI